MQFNTRWKLNKGWIKQHTYIVRFFFIKKEKLIFLLSKDVKLITSDSKYIYDVTKDLYFKYILFFWTFYS